MPLSGRLLVTGGAGFIGSTWVRQVLRNEADVRVTVLDKLTYAGNLANLREVEDDPRYRFVKGDIADRGLVSELAADADTIVNFAAESHVDRSIEEPDAFIRTDVLGTHVLLEAARRAGHRRYLQISTDEVYGDVAHGASLETDPLRPRSPYSASKASGDLLVSAYFATYGLPTLVTRASNNFGPYQYPEKLIPLFITNALDDEPLPLYGDGRQVRDWLYVEDHCTAISVVLERGEPGGIYNIGGSGGRNGEAGSRETGGGGGSGGAGEPQVTNLELTEMVLAELGKPRSLIRHVEDRPGHDRRYAIDSGLVRALGWRPQRTLREALAETVRWYVEHPEWWRPLKTGEYLDYYRRQYGARLAASDAGSVAERL